MDLGLSTNNTASQQRLLSNSTRDALPASSNDDSAINSRATSPQPLTTSPLSAINPTHQRDSQAPRLPQTLTNSITTSLRAPQWPQTRSLSQIQCLHTPHTIESFQSEPISERNLLEQIPENGVVIDFGAGSGRFLAELKSAANEISKPINTIAVSATEIDEERYLRGEALIDRVYYTFVPEASGERPLLNDLKGSCALILDSYGPTSYTQNPVHLLIYAALMLQPQGQFSSLSSTGFNGKVEIDNLQRERLSMFGDSQTQKALQTFFANHLGIHNLTFQQTVIRSEVQDKPLKVDMLVQFNGSQQAASLSESVLDSLFQLANQEIGLPENDKTNHWFQADSFNIMTKCYQPMHNPSMEA